MRIAGDRANSAVRTRCETFPIDFRAARAQRALARYLAMSGRKHVTFRDIRAQFDHVDDPDALERAKSNPALAHAMDWLRPKNWHGCALTPNQIVPIADESGIPIAWVPSAEVLAQIAAVDVSDRIGVLLSHEDEVLGQCESLLLSCSDPLIDDAQSLAQRALLAFHAGHHEAAMALAVNVAEGLALWASRRRDFMFEGRQSDEAAESQVSGYALAGEKLRLLDSKEHRSRFDVVHEALLAPIPSFFAKYRIEDGDPIPDTASRHATVHQPTCAHLSRSNALLSLMLCVSLLRHQQWVLDEHRD